jgi:large subunit ribosomal protein L25
MSTIKLKARLRNEEKQSQDDKVRAVIYGPNSKNRNLELDYREFAKAYAQAGESSLIDLVVEDKDPVKVLIQDIQKDPVSDKYRHIDFYELDMNKKLSLDVELVFTGTEEVEKLSGGEVTRNMDKIEVECLPKDLVREIEVKLTDFLKEIGDTLHAGQIKLPEGLVLVTDKEASIISVQEIKEEIIEAPVEEEAEEAEGEDEEKEGEEKEGEEKEGEEKPEAGEGKPEAKTEEKSQEKKEEK